MLEGWKEDQRNKYSADELLDVYIKLYNDCISKVPNDMHVGIHLCRGTSAASRKHGIPAHSPAHMRPASTPQQPRTTNAYHLLTPPISPLSPHGTLS